MPFHTYTEIVREDARLSLEEGVCLRAAQVMRACAADVGLDHPWRDRFEELASQFEEDAATVAALPAPAGSEGPPAPVIPLRLVS